MTTFYEEAIDTMIDYGMYPVDAGFPDVPEWVDRLDFGGVTVMADDSVLHAVAHGNAIIVRWYSPTGDIEGRARFAGSRAIPMFKKFLGIA